jgi:hypothetical protein
MQKMGVKNIPEEINVPEKLQEIGQKLSAYKDAIVKLKDMEIEVKNWNFAVGKTEAEYTLGITLNLAIRPKKEHPAP